MLGAWLAGTCARLFDPVLALTGGGGGLRGVVCVVVVAARHRGTTVTAPGLSTAEADTGWTLPHVMESTETGTRAGRGRDASVLSPSALLTARALLLGARRQRCGQY
eukprot:gene15836-biopygen9749